MLQQPNLIAKEVPEKVLRYLRTLVGQIQPKLNQVDVMAQAGYLTPGVANTLYGAKISSQSLQASGSNPLNVTGLVGVLAQPQNAGIPAVTALPKAGTPLAQDGAIVSYNGVLYRFTAAPAPGAWKVLTALGVILEDSHANRLNTSTFPQYDPTKLPIGVEFYETDRTVVYVVKLVGGVNIWQYVCGEMQSGSSTLADLPTDLDSNAYGFKFASIYYQRIWRWTSTGWQYADAGLGAGAQVTTSSSSTPPEGGYWQFCDGSTVTCALNNATIGSKIASNTSATGSNNPFIEGGNGLASNAAQQVGVAPAFSGPVTSNVDAGAGTVVQSGTGVTVAAHTHVHSIPAVNLNGMTQVPSETAGGLPLRVSMAWWMRR